MTLDERLMPYKPDADHGAGVTAPLPRRRSPGSGCRRRRCLSSGRRVPARQGCSSPAAPDAERVVRRDADRDGPGPAMVGESGKPPHVSRTHLCIPPRDIEVPYPVGAQVTVDPPFGIRYGARAGANRGQAGKRTTMPRGPGRTRGPSMQGIFVSRSTASRRISTPCATMASPSGCPGRSAWLR